MDGVRRRVRVISLDAVIDGVKPERVRVTVIECDTEARSESVPVRGTETDSDDVMDSDLLIVPVGVSVPDAVADGRSESVLLLVNPDCV
jgi:hypothetical protein